MKEFFKKNWMLSLTCLFIIVNIALLATTLTTTKKKKNEYQKLISELKQNYQTSNKNQFIPNENFDFYDSPCPEFSKYSISDEEINIRDLVGNVILLRFSRFFREDLANLIYLQHLADKYRKYGVSLIFINTRGKHDAEAISKIINLKYPIIEDDGSIAARFNAYFEDLIIVDRNFNMKFKYHFGSKSMIYKEVVKWVFKDIQKRNSINENDLAAILKKLTFEDIFEKRKRKISEFKNKRICLTLFTSTCTGCEEGLRIRHLRELAKNIDRNRAEIIILFGNGNNIEAIRQHAILNQWEKLPISIGVVSDLNDLSEDEYFQIFQLELDPRTLIIESEGNVTFYETKKTTKMIFPDFLKNQLT